MHTPQENVRDPSVSVYEGRGAFLTGAAANGDGAPDTGDRTFSVSAISCWHEQPHSREKPEKAADAGPWLKQNSALQTQRSGHSGSLLTEIQEFTWI